MLLTGEDMPRKLSGLVWLSVGLVIGAMAGETYVIDTLAPRESSRQNVYVFNFATGEFIALTHDATRVMIKMPLGLRLGHAIVSQDGKFVYGVSAEGRTLLVLDSATLQLSSEIPLPGRGEDLSLSEDGRRLLVTTRDSDGLAVISTVNNALIGHITLAGSPHGLVVDRSRHTAYVALTGQNKVVAVALEDLREIRSYIVGSKPTMLSLSSDGRWLSVANSGEDSITLIVLPKGQSHQIRVGEGPRGIAFSSGKFYVASWKDYSISIVDPVSATVERKLKMDHRPVMIEKALSGGLLVAADGAVIALSLDGAIVGTVTIEGLQPSALLSMSGPTSAQGRHPSPGRLDSKNFTCGG